MNLILGFVFAYVFTNIVEFVPLHLILKKDFQEEVIGLFKINSITLPVVWFVLLFFFNELFLVVFIIVESLVILAETFLVEKVFKQQAGDAFIIALAMNLPSAALTLVF